MKAYKVVINEGNKLVSCLPEIGFAKITYIPGVETNPNIEGSLIFIFHESELIRFGKVFCKSICGELWEVETDEIIPIEHYLLIPDVKEINLYWTPNEKLTNNDDIKAKQKLSIYDCNYFGCKSLTLIKKL